MELDSAKEAFVHLLGQIQQDSKLEFLKWVCEEYNPIDSLSNGDDMTEEPEENELLDSIVEDLRNTVPPTALAPGENQIFPTQGKNTGLTDANTLHVDSFLYPSEEDVDQLCSQLNISRNYCLNCGSWKTLPLNFITHSLSREQLKFLFSDLLPDLNRKVVVDIGSRLGPVLYGAYVHSRASQIYGVEMSSYFCELQLSIITKYNLGSRLQVVCSDVCQQAELLERADVIILNNVFEFFCTLEEQARIWEFLFSKVRKKGTLLVTVPSIQESWNNISFKAPLAQWVTEIPTGISSDDEELSGIHLYCVL